MRLVDEMEWSVGIAEPVLVAAPLGAPARIAADLVPGSCTAVPYEHPGHAGTPALPRASSMSDFAHAALRAGTRSAPGPMAIVGVGFGAMVALQAALDQPHRVSCLVVISGSAAPGNSEGWGERAAAARTGGLESLAPAIVSRWLTAELRSARPQLLRELRAALMTCGNEGYAVACEAIASFDISHRLGQIEAPTMVVAGAEDVGVPPEHGRRLADETPNASYHELAGAGHLPFLDCPDLVRALVSQHLAATLLGRPSGGES